MSTGTLVKCKGCAGEGKILYCRVHCPNGTEYGTKKHYIVIPAKPSVIHQSFENLEDAMNDGYWEPECPECGMSRRLEPDAQGWTCEQCGEKVEIITLI